MPAQYAEAQLQERITETVQHQRDRACDLLGGRSIVFTPIRWLLTIGAALWFPIVQPVLQVALAPGWTGSSRETIYLAVQLMSAGYLLKTVGFLVLYFVLLWAFLRWDTHRRVTRLINRMNASDGDATLSLPRQVLDWVDELLEPMRSDVERSGDLAKRIDEAKRDLK